MFDRIRRQRFVRCVTILSALALGHGAEAVAAADSRAVEAVNYQVAASVGQSDFSQDGVRDRYAALSGVMTMPLLAYLGGELGGSYSHDNFEASSLSCNLNGSSVGAGLFLRDFDVGRLGFQYADSRGRETCSYPNVTSINRVEFKDKASYAYAAYYFPLWTLGASRSRTTPDRDNPIAAEPYYSSSVNAIYYPASYASVEFAAYRANGSNAQALTVEFQPGLLDHSTSLMLAYSRSQHSHSIGLGVAYYFDKRVDLITRDRLYR